LSNSRKAAGLNASPLGEEPNPPTPPQLEHTGERFLPGITGTTEISYDHIARYRFAEQYIKGKKTIDLGSGVGYGTYSLSKFAEDVLGVDISEEAVAYAACCYEAPNLSYQVGDVTNTPYPNESFEAAISFEVIEHLERPEALVEEALRLLKEDGIFVVSTPDKQTYSNDRNYVNPHHLKEMYPLEFRKILKQYFRHVQIYRQGALAGSIITPDLSELSEDGQLTLESTRFSLPDPKFGREVPVTLYMIAVCANGSAPEPLQHPHLMLDYDRQIYDELADWHATLGPLLAMYHAHEQERVQRKVQETLQRSRMWRLAQKVRSLNERAHSLLRRR
jgi:2-polyprenyl-3-methyl-5-hydroxy-6-metoxy-1,4-benzoquinol methylase